MDPHHQQTDFPSLEFRNKIIEKLQPLIAAKPLNNQQQQLVPPGDAKTVESFVFEKSHNNREEYLKIVNKVFRALAPAQPTTMHNQMNYGHPPDPIPMGMQQQNQQYMQQQPRMMNMPQMQRHPTSSYGGPPPGMSAPPYANQGPPMMQQQRPMMSQPRMAEPSAQYLQQFFNNLPPQFQQQIRTLPAEAADRHLRSLHQKFMERKAANLAQQQQQQQQQQVYNQPGPAPPQFGMRPESPMIPPNATISYQQPPQAAYGPPRVSAPMPVSSIQTMQRAYGQPPQDTMAGGMSVPIPYSSSQPVASVGYAPPVPQPPRPAYQPMVPSPAFVNSPAGVKMPEMSPSYPAAAKHLDQSPAPSQPGSVGPADGVSSQTAAPDDATYNAKIKELQPYLEQLKKTIERDKTMGKSTIKLERVVEIIEGTRRVNTDLLLKCETLVKQIGSQQDNLVSSMCQPFLDSVASVLKTPQGDEALQCSFEDPWNSVKDMSIAVPEHFRSTEADMVDESSYDMNDDSLTIECADGKTIILPISVQEEIDMLNGKFSCKVDPDFTPLTDKAKCITLLCSIVNHKLPYVPPLRLDVPMEYPQKGVTLCDDLTDYSGVTLFESIGTLLRNQVNTLDEQLLSTVLDCWESSIEKAVLMK